ncbi:MAG: YfhO family protein [Clostridia bacterium]|nr:YfhO family protein [Clostridia bacterium]
MVLSYYVTYMMVVYALVRFCAGYAFGYGDRKRAINFVLGSFFAALATAAVYIPVLVQYARSARTGTITEGLRNSAMITATDTTLLPVLCLSVILPFFLDATQRKEERIDRLMVVLTAVPLFLEPVNKMWQTGSYMSFPSRYSFMLIFSVIAFVGKRFGGQKENYKIKSYVKWPAFGFLISGFIWAVIYTVKYSSANIGVLSKFSGTLWGSDESLTAFFRYYAVIIAFSAALFAAYKFRLASGTFIAAALFALVVNEAFFSAKPYMASPSHETDGYKSMMQAADLVPDEGFYRVNSKSKMFSGSDGVGINAVGAMGYNSIAHYTSLTSADYMNAVKQLGYSSYWMEVADYGGTKFSDAFLINKYTFVNSGLSSAKYSTEKYGLKENPVLPLGLVARGDPRPVLQGERSDIAEQLYRDITGKSGLITKYPIQSAEFYGVEYSYENGVHTLKKEGEGAATVTVTAVVSGRQTLYFDCFDLYTNALRQHVNECFNVKVNGRTVAYNFPSQSNNGFLNLGEFENATVKITLTLNKDFYGRSLGVFGESVLKVNEAVESFENAGFEVSGNKISGKITAAANGKLVFCLPYDEGYRFTVNGKRVKAEKVLTDFIAVPVEGGENVVKAVYIPRGFIAGTCVSLVGVAAFAVFVALGKKREYFIYSPFFEKTGRAFNILAFAVSSLAVIAVYVFPMILAML